jgi:SulP family sulfate permease
MEETAVYGERADAEAASPAAESSPAWQSYLPALAVLRTYSLKALAADLGAGLTVAAVALPQGMAYAQVAGLPPQVGLYTAIVPTLVAAFFCPCRQLVDGPTNAIAIALLSALAWLPAGETRMAAAVLLALLVGLLQLGVRLLRLGDLTRFISQGVVVGFTLGAGVLLVMDQMKSLLGLPERGAAGEHFLRRFGRTLWEGQVHGPTAAIGLGTIAGILLLQGLKARLRPRLRLLLPEFLLTVLVMALIVWALGLARPEAGANAVAVVGSLPQTLPPLRWPLTGEVPARQLVFSALAISLLGLLEAIAMARNLSGPANKLDIHQLCLSEGLGNLVGSCFGCMPAAGSLTRSAVNQQAGAVSQWSAILSAGAVAGTLLVFAPWASYIPRAALAGLLIVTAGRMIDWRQLRYYLRATPYDAGIVLATALAAVLVSVEFCIVIGVFLSFFLYVPRAARVDFTELVVTPERVIRERLAGDPPCSRILIYNLEGELFFATAPELQRNLENVLERARQGVRVVVLRLKRVRNPDAMCLSLLEQFIKHLQEQGTRVLFCGVRADLARALHATGLTNLLGPEHIFHETPVLISSTLEAVRHAYDLLGQDLCPTCPRRQLPSDSEPWYYMI